ncbi:MAG: TetR/AcrR family transcriptional regulator [Euryarchaeota archaeon]|nr:TetR/AcrR family transcriptional regulator [Euryarchaeota archaeon]
MARRKDARTRLLDAALELSCRRGFDGVTTRAIARRAGANEVTLFRLFGTKEKLFFALLDREADMEQRLPPGGFPATGDVVEDLSLIGSFMLAGMLEKAPILKLGMTEMHRRPRMWRRIEPAPRAAIELLSGYFEEAAREGLIRKVDPRMAAMVFFSFFFRSFVMTAFLGKDMFITMDDRAIRAFCSMFVEGLRKG